MLRYREDVQGEPASKGNVLNINFRQALEQGRRNVNVREQEEEIVVSIVLVVIRQGEITAGPQSTVAVGLKLETLFAFPLGRYLHVVT